MIQPRRLYPPATTPCEINDAGYDYAASILFSLTQSLKIRIADLRKNNRFAESDELLRTINAIQDILQGVYADELQHSNCYVEQDLDDILHYVFNSDLYEIHY